MSGSRGIVYLVGAGPGDPDLVTVAGLRALRSADVVVHDRLAPRELLGKLAPKTERVDAGKAPGRHAMSQCEINALLVRRARAGATVVRLKGGDPHVFGRGAEEAAACRSAGIACVVIPGVSSAVAGPAAIDVPVTRRGIARSFAVVTAQAGAGEIGPGMDPAALLDVDTLIVLMGRGEIAGWTGQLVAAGKDADTPAACVQDATTHRQRSVFATLGTLADALERAELQSPMVAVVGEVAREQRVEELREALPLAGRRIVLTGSRSHTGRVRRAVEAAGGLPIACPMIRVSYPESAPELDASLDRLADYDWIVFTSVHGVQGLFKRLRACGRDARALGACRVAAVGQATSRRLKRRGILADLVATETTADGLADELLDRAQPRPRRVLCPCSDRARRTLADRLRSVGVGIDTVVAYRTEEAATSEEAAAVLGDAVDAVVFSSPSAVASFARRHAMPAGALRAAIGPVTAAAMASVGMPADVVAQTASADAMVAALERYYLHAEVTR